MTGFLTRLMDRHLKPECNVLPQLRGRFEPGRSLSLSRGGQYTYTGNETDIEFDLAHPAAEVKSSNKSARPVLRNVPLINENVNIPSEKNVIKPIFSDRPVQMNVPLMNDNVGNHVPSAKTVSKSILEGKTKNKTGIRHSTKNATEPDKEHTKEMFNEIEKVIPIRKENRKKVVSSEPIQESTHSSQEYQITDVNEKFVVHDLQKQTERGHEIIKETRKFFVQPVFLDSGMTPLPDKLKRTYNLQETRNGVLHTPAWSGKQNAGLIRETVLKETRTQSSPTIKVNIGRIEVRAIMQQAQTPTQTIESPKPKLSLDDYLNQRKR